MTSSTQEAGNQEEACTRVVENACATTIGRGESSRSPTPARRHARSVGRQTDALKSTTVTTGQRSTLTSPSEAGCATPAITGAGEEELKSLLLEGWMKGYLAPQRPACPCSRYLPGDRD